MVEESAFRSALITHHSALSSRRVPKRPLAIREARLDDADARPQRLQLLAEVVRVIAGVGHHLFHIIARLAERNALGVDRRFHVLIGTPETGTVRTGVVG